MSIDYNYNLNFLKNLEEEEVKKVRRDPDEPRGLDEEAADAEEEEEEEEEY